MYQRGKNLMTGHERPETTSRPGALALSLAGIMELLISGTLFGIELYAPAIAFGIGALFVALIANAIAGQGRSMQMRRGMAPEPETERARNMRHAGFYGAALLGTGAVIAAIITMVGGDVMPAATFGVWALTCAVFALRFR
jgi:hypothetical protein